MALVAAWEGAVGSPFAGAGSHIAAVEGRSLVAGAGIGLGVGWGEVLLVEWALVVGGLVVRV